MREGQSWENSMLKLPVSPEFLNLLQESVLKNKEGNPLRCMISVLVYFLSRCHRFSWDGSFPLGEFSALQRFQLISSPELTWGGTGAQL